MNSLNQPIKCHLSDMVPIAEQLRARMAASADAVSSSVFANSPIQRLCYFQFDESDRLFGWLVNQRTIAVDDVSHRLLQMKPPVGVMMEHVAATKGTASADVHRCCSYHASGQLLLDSALSRLEDSTFCIVEKVPLPELMEEALESVKVIAKHFAVPLPDIKVKVAGTLPENLLVEVYRPMVVYTFNEVLKNAIRHHSVPEDASGEKAIVVEINGTEELRRVTISNRCRTPIPANVQEKIWNFNFTTLREVNEWSGSGVGLSLSRIYMQILGGKITLTSPVDPVAFTLDIPVNMKETLA